MKNIIILPFLIAFSTQAFAQINAFGLAKPCIPNVDQSKNIPIKATFKIFNTDAINGGVATGVLINRATTQDNLGFFFVTGAHVFENELNELPDHVYEFVFNYQSPTGSNNDVPNSNRGLEPIVFQSTSTGDNGFHYVHKSKIRLVALINSASQDFALLEILTPIPPHFNVGYIGWNPSLPFNPFGSYSVMHHPQGDIKKVTTSNFVVGGQPVNQACRLVTKIIDTVFGWIWKRKVAVEVICNYTETGILKVINNSGITEGGSSGAGLTAPDSKLVATLFGGSEISACDKKTDSYRKFRTSYYRQTIKNTLNPDDFYYADQWGESGRIIDCYTKLENLGGEYFAASAYQTENKITLKSNTTATLKTGEKIRVHPGADYAIFAKEFSMGFNTNIEFVPPRPNVNEIRGIFEIKTFNTPCIQTRQNPNYTNLPPMFWENVNNMLLPQYKPLNLGQYANNDNNDNNDNIEEKDIDVFPNPSETGNFTLRFVSNNEKQVDLILKDVLGKTVYNARIQCIQGENFHILNLENYKLNLGIYFIVINEGQNTRVQKVVIGN